MLNMITFEQAERAARKTIEKVFSNVGKAHHTIDSASNLFINEVTKEYESTTFKPFDMVLHIPSNTEGIVKRTSGAGVFVLFRIQSTAQLCNENDLKLL